MNAIWRVVRALFRTRFGQRKPPSPRPPPTIPLPPTVLPPVHLPRWKTVTQAELDHWTGDFCGMFLPEIAPDGPTDSRTGIRRGQFRGIDDGLLFTPHLDAYTPALRQVIYDAYFIQRPYTHLPLNLTSGATSGYSYNNTYPNRPFDKALVNTLLHEVWEHGIPVGVGWGLNDVDSDDAVRAFLALLDDPSMLPIMQLGFEIDHETSRPEIAARFERWERLAPAVSTALQFSSGHGAGDTPEADWWRNGWRLGQEFELANWVDGVEMGTYLKRMDYAWKGAQNVANLRYVLLDNDDFRDPARMVENCGDMLVRLTKGGYRWNLNRSFQVVAMELTAYEHTTAGRATADETYGLVHADALLSVAYRQSYINPAGFAGRLAGFCNGGAPRP